MSGIESGQSIVICGRPGDCYNRRGNTPQGRPMNHRARNGLTLVDVCVLLAAVALLLAITLPTAHQANEYSNRVECARNLRLIGQAIAMYSNNETRNGNAFPRTYYEPDAPLTQTDAGSTSPSPGYNQPQTFVPRETPSPVGTNNVLASIYLILKAQPDAVNPAAFNCPSTGATPDPLGTTPPAKPIPDKYSCWDAPANQYLSYSMQVPFASKAALSTGFKWNAAIAPDFAVMADISPGTPQVLTVTPGSSKAQMAAANSPNHGGDGQNVLYGDFHVEFCATPFAGAMRTADSATAVQDNIYAFGTGTGPSGIVGPPQDRFDSVLLPVIGANPPKAPLMIKPGMILLLLAGIAVVVIAGVVILVILLVKRSGRAAAMPPPALPPQ